MGATQFDVVIVGAGCAGATAALGLAKAGFSVAMVEAAAYPGAENWSGCVYFCENLADPSLLGPQGVEGLAWERRLVERGLFASNGHGTLGMAYRDPAAFRHCYTVLRPIFDHHLAQLAVQAGAVLLNSTTAESLIRDGGRVVGVATNRGPLYADLTYLAEGDASHLVTREGYERSTDPGHQPRFLHGIKQVIDLPPGAVEENFGLGPEEGAAYEILLRNGSLNGRRVHLNMGGFVYTNRQSLSIGLVLPADHLHTGFGGDPNLLMEWFESLPDIRRWCRGGRRGVFGAKLIRGGGARDIPHLVDHGLAIGGAASAIGVDFPYPNFTGPATRMGLQLVEAVGAIRRAGGNFTPELLQQHYVEPLKRTHYWQDVEYLRRWPAYVERTRFFFDQNLDTVLGTAHLWTRPRRGFLRKWTSWIKMLLHVAGPGRWGEIRRELEQLGRALRVEDVASQPSWGRFLTHGWGNALRDLFRRGRKHLPPAGTVRFVYSGAGNPSAHGRPPWLVRRWFRRFAPVLAAAARHVYVNDQTPLGTKLQNAFNLLLRQTNIFDVFVATTAGLLGVVTGLLVMGWERMRSLFGGRGHALAVPPPKGFYAEFVHAADRAGDLSPLVPVAAQKWEDRLGRLGYETIKRSHTQVLWPWELERKNAVTQAGLWHVCPAHVYEAHAVSPGQVQIVVNFENCIKCETCWRTSELVDWGRDGSHRFIYPVGSPTVERLLAAADAAGAIPAAPAKTVDWWTPTTKSLALRLASERGGDGETLADDATGRILRVVGQLEQKLEEFEEALGREPRTMDRWRADYLELLVRYAHQLADRLSADLRAIAPPSTGSAAAQDASRHLSELALAVAGKVEDMARRAGHRKFRWAAADARQLRQHHLPGLRRLLLVLHPHPVEATDASRNWLRAEDDADTVASEIDAWIRRLDEVFPPTAWRDLEQRGQLTPPQDALLLELLDQVCQVGSNDRAPEPHPPLRKALLAELARRDASLAFRAASHLWARDLAARFGGATGPTTSTSWRAFAVTGNGRVEEGRCYGEAIFVPEAENTLLLVGQQLVPIPMEAMGLVREPLRTLGLRGARLQRITLDGMPLPISAVVVDANDVVRAWEVLSSADLVSAAHGLAGLLVRRSVDHALGRVQFPGLFQDDQARDGVAKFGAVKQMIADMGARHYLIETLDANLSPGDLSAETHQQAVLAKALVAEALGTAPGSLAYNAGQIFGGTGFSEDDILSKAYRDAAAWRFLGAANPAVWHHHGTNLLTAWADGKGLSSLKNEAEHFDELAQRKAMQAELDELRVMRTRLRRLLAAPPGDHGPAVAAQLARFDAELLASKALLLRTHARLEHGLPAERPLAWVRVWLDHAADTLDAFDKLVNRSASDFPATTAAPSTGNAPIAEYQRFLETPAPYDSGDFACRAPNVAQPRFVPEMLASDPELAETERRFRALITDHFGPRNGRPYERHVEHRHGIDPEDLIYCIEQGLFRLLIPKELGGEGRRKAEYSLAVSNAQRLADVSVALSIQVSTSLSMTPVSLARDKELPQAGKDLAAFIGDSALQREVQEQLEQGVRSLEAGKARRVSAVVNQLDARVRAAVFARPAVKLLAGRFAEAWVRAGDALARQDGAGLRTHLASALDAWKDSCVRAPELLAELGRRREACEQYLRWMVSGQIAAFALTEPSAGSDTARLVTRAKPRSVPVDIEPDGAYRFVLPGDKRPRYLVDARKLEFQPDGVYYRWSEQAPSSRIHFDEYDYETDFRRCMRYYQHGDRRVYFTDIAQLRERDGRLWYDYWELYGSKMWITNGRICGVMCLYAKTDEGVTGFMVDRHAEGLIVGKDEAKMGQNGSVTNELALQAVRVPRENVLGLEGRGQQNALETLNVGRAGLAFTWAVQLDGIIGAARDFAAKNQGDHPWTKWRIDRMEADRFAAEALAFEVIGRFDHPGTRSIRLESAIAKMQVSELLQEVIELSEEVHGLAGQTTQHLIEKRKRDARVLNIYEGTNEIQRFLILKDLVTEVAPRYQGTGKPVLTADDPLTSVLHGLWAELHRRLGAAVQTFGAGLWQDANLQADGFLLAEAAAWLKTADSVAGRLAWLAARDPIGNREALAIGQRSLARCADEVRRRLGRFDLALARLRQGRYAPSVRAAGLMYDEAASGPVATRSYRSTITRPLSVLVVLEPSIGPVPNPQVEHGRLMEAHVALTDADRAALETALRLRDQARDLVSIQVAAVGPKRLVPVLREVASLNLDPILLVLSPSEELFPEAAARAVCATLHRQGKRFDLIIGPAGGANVGEGLFAPLVAERLEAPFAGTCATLGVRWSENEALALLGGAVTGPPRLRSLPAAVTVEPGLPVRAFTTADYLTALHRPIVLEPWPEDLRAEVVRWSVAARSTKEERAAASGPLQPAESAELVLAEIGRRPGGVETPPGAAAFAVEDVRAPEVLERQVALAVVACDAEGRLAAGALNVIRAANLVAGLPGGSAVLLLAPSGETGQRRAAAQLADAGVESAAMMVVDAARAASAELRARLLGEAWPQLKHPPRVVIGEPWTEYALATVRERAGGPGDLALRVHRLERTGTKLQVQTLRAQGKLQTLRVVTMASDRTHWISLAGDADVPGERRSSSSAGAHPLLIHRWAPEFRHVFGRADIQRMLEDLKEDAGVARLVDAEFIIDVGSGIGNRDGYEQVIVPLEQTLRALGVRSLMIGGSRKVTEEMHILPADRQIGQSGVSVNPRVLVAIGISGAPQHLNYIGPRATVIAFNRDPEAPIMTLNQRQPRPRVFPVVGDLFETVPAFTAALSREHSV